MTTPFTMVGADDALVCEGDSCLVPLRIEGTAGTAADVPDVEPPADEAAAASGRAIAAALDEGASL